MCNSRNLRERERERERERSLLLAYQNMSLLSRYFEAFVPENVEKYFWTRITQLSRSLA